MVTHLYRYLRYSRADCCVVDMFTYIYSIHTQTLILTILSQITHRSVGEPAEGSLTRIQRYQPIRPPVFSHITHRWRALLRVVLGHRPTSPGVRLGLTVEDGQTLDLPHSPSLH